MIAFEIDMLCWLLLAAFFAGGFVQYRLDQAELDRHFREADGDNDGDADADAGMAGEVPR